MRYEYLTYPFILLLFISCIKANKNSVLTNQSSGNTKNDLQFNVSIETSDRGNLNNFLRKTKISYPLLLRNKLDYNIYATLSCVEKENIFDKIFNTKKGRIQKTNILTIEHGLTKKISCPKDYYVDSLKINPNPSDLNSKNFFNITYTKKMIFIELSPFMIYKNLFSQIIFDDEYFLQCYEETSTYINYYIKNKTIFNLMSEIKETFHQIYTGKILKSNITPPKAIPEITHHIWMTSSSNPKDLPDNFINNIVYTAHILPKWRHIVWIFNENKIPYTTSKLSKTHYQIEIKSIENYDFPHNEDKELITSLISEKKFGLASDFFRVMVLNKMGGVYMDTDYILLENIKRLTKHLTFFASLQPYSALIGNAIIGSINNHPILDFMYNKIKENILGVTPLFLDQFSTIHQTIFKSGPGLLLHAYYIYKNPNENFHDVIFPSSLFYPTNNKKPYPKNFLSIDDAYDPIALGQHFWEGMWFKKGNNG